MQNQYVIGVAIVLGITILYIWKRPKTSSPSLPVQQGNGQPYVDQDVVKVAEYIPSEPRVVHDSISITDPKTTQETLEIVQKVDPKSLESQRALDLAATIPDTVVGQQVLHPKSYSYVEWKRDHPSNAPKKIDYSGVLPTLVGDSSNDYD